MTTERRKRRPGAGRKKGSVDAERTRLAMHVVIRLAELEAEMTAPSDGETAKVVSLLPLPSLLNDPGTAVRAVILLSLGLTGAATAAEEEAELEGFADGVTVLAASFDVAMELLDEQDRAIIEAAVARDLCLDPETLTPHSAHAAVRKRSRGARGFAPERTVPSYVRSCLSWMRECNLDVLAKRAAERELELAGGKDRSLLEEILEEENELSLELTYEPRVAARARDHRRRWALATESHAARARQRAEAAGGEPDTTDAEQRAARIQQAAERLEHLWEKARKAYRDRQRAWQDAPGRVSAECDPSLGGHLASACHPGWPPPEGDAAHHPPVCVCSLEVGPHYHCQVCDAVVLPPASLSFEHVRGRAESIICACSRECFDRWRRKSPNRPKE